MPVNRHHTENPVKVSRRNGINYVFNGQHTIEIVALVSGSRDTPVWCMVYDILQRSLRLCIATWEGDVDSLTSNILRGITHLIVAYEDSLKDDMFVEKVGRSSSREIGRIAKERKTGSKK